ncbi:hypothetical protein ACFPYN_09205 [Paenisporosarcina macmurdoensis]|uniref:Uncharacterized protein n=1 Tax=Paenisporosarcina macmurdoensis TaxID=212659 RepID=A0ABW1L6P7_9BACL
MIISFLDKGNLSYAKRTEDRKISTLIKIKNNKLFAMAGLRLSWKSPNWELGPLWNKGIDSCSSEK